MANNTKLVGFITDGVVLERWGKSANVPLPPMAMDALRNACYQVLPKKPQGTFDSHNGLFSVDRFSCHFEETVDGGQFMMGVGVIHYFLKVLEESKAAGDEKAQEYIDAFNGILAAHAAWHDPKGEPGVDESADPTLVQESSTNS